LMDRDELLNAYYKKIYKLALYQLQNVPEAEDLTHDIFYKVLSSLDTFQKRSGIYTWIYRIALNTIRNHIRRKKIVRFISLEEKQPEGFEYLMWTGEDPAEKTEEEQEKGLKLERLGKALKKLSARERTAFFFFYFEKMKQKEIAAVMGTSLSAVESLVYKSMKKIKRELA